MPKDQIVMGLMIAALCGLGLYHTRWMLDRTGKGRALKRWLGEPSAPWVWRGLMLAGVAFGLLLAGDVIRPIHWSF